MFTIKLYADGAYRMKIMQADEFTVLRSFSDAGDAWSEITAHRKSGDDIRFDVGNSPALPDGGVWEKVIIENAAGRTTEIIGYDRIPMSIGDKVAA